MTIYLGDFPTGKTIYVPFHTFNSSGASVTITGLAVTDIEVYRNGSVTQRASDAGYALLDTDGIDFDGLTGIHGFSIDTSDNTDAGFYAAGYDYWVVVSAITVDAQTVSFVAAIFSIDNRQLLRPTTASRTVDVTTTGEVGLDFGNVNLPVGSIPIVNIIENGTMQAGSAAGTAVLRSATSFVDDLIIGATIIITGGTGAGQSRIIYDWVSTTDTASISPNWTTTPDNTSTYLVIPTPPASTNSATLPAVNLTSWNGTAVATPDTAGYPKVTIKDGTGAGEIALTSGAIDTVTAVTTVNGLAANVITAAATAADFTTEIQSGLATAAALDAVDNFLDTEIAAILALLDDPRTEPGQGAPPVNPDLATKIDYLYKAWRNRSTQTATTYSLYADDGTTVDQKATVSDDGTTFVKGEVATGP